MERQEVYNGADNKAPYGEKGPPVAAPDHIDEGYYGEIVDVKHSTKRGLKPRHSQMIALGGTIVCIRPLP